jgi:hypothetical protein
MLIWFILLVDLIDVLVEASNRENEHEEYPEHSHDE